MALRRHATIKMCRDPRHTFIFHAPEGRASYAEGVLHVPQARFICGAAAKTPQLFAQRAKNITRGKTADITKKAALRRGLLLHSIKIPRPEA